MTNVILKHQPWSDGFTMSTNMHRRDVLQWHDLTDAERSEFDYYGADGPTGGGSFVRYGGSTLDLDDCDGVICRDGNGDLWSIVSDSFFSGIAFRWDMDDHDVRVIIGRYGV